jgi:hypothetical protein
MSYSPSLKSIIIPRPNDAVTLKVTHTCGHVAGYFYGGESFALANRASLELQKCFSCINSDKLAECKRQDASGLTSLRR